MSPSPRLSTLALACVVWIGLPPAVLAQDAEAVIAWNRIVQTTVAGTPTPTVFFTRPFALVHVAVFDALNSIDRVYHPFVVEVTASPTASRAAAAAQAAHDVLVALYPSQRTALDAALATTLAGLPAEAAQEGSRVGAAVAAACLEARTGDGWERQPSEYIPTNGPGYYQLTPGATTVTFTHYPDVKPFAIGHRLQFLVGQPPALTSEHYAADLNEVKAVGRATGSTRTEEQTSIARRWAGVGTSTSLQIVWNNLVRDLTRQHGLNAVDTARAFLLVNVAVHDALLVSFSGKFLYALWRPVTAIREANRDGNPATDADPTWTPLLGTPPYPAYPGNMACVAASASRTLERIFGRNDIQLTVTWTGTAGNADITRSYNGLRELADEEARSRVLGGIHFTFDNLASFGVCVPLADYVFENYARARFPTR